MIGHEITHGYDATGNTPFVSGDFCRLLIRPNKKVCLG